jgi:hypothetical protein
MRRPDLSWQRGRAELDVYYAHLYGLNRDERRDILDPADVMGPDYASQTFRVLKTNEIRQFGEFRTQRLVLEAWDRLFGVADVLLERPDLARPWIVRNDEMEAPWCTSRHG